MTIELLDKPSSASAASAKSVMPKLPYQALVISSVERFDAMRDVWNDFLKQAGVHNLCMFHGWLMTWLRHFQPEQLFIVIVKDDEGRWVGAAPLKISTSKTGLTHRMLRHVQFIGTHPTVFDWMTFAILPGADRQVVMDVVARTLQKAKWDVLDLMYTLEHDLLERFCHSLGKAEPAQVIQETTPIPYLRLPATEAEYEPTRRKKTRLEVNRHCNRFAKEFGNPLRLEFQPATEASDAILTRFFAGHIKYWAEKGFKSDFQRFPNLFQFYKDMLAYSQQQVVESEPRLLFSVLKMDDYQLSYHLGFWQGNGYLSHITHFNQGFKGYSPGTIHMDKLVFDTIRRGGVEFEFGRGDEPYKKMWTQEKKPLWNMRIFRNPVSQAIWNIDILLKKMTGKAVE
jgi:CelD/BcsL family acetyltransferase involved in cellulose biosynthesis